MTISKIVAVAALVAFFSAVALAQTPTPAGRLTLTSNTPVMTGDVTGATAVYYVTYNGNTIPVAQGTSIGVTTFTSLTLTLSTTHQLSGNIYDIFFVNSGGYALCTGPEWSNATSRGSGTGTSQINQFAGVWTNAVTLSHCYNNLADYGPISANSALYLGSIYMTGDGETSVNITPASASGGSNSIIGIWNAYNRVSIRTASADNTSTWTYSSSTWRAADNSDSNRISWIDGLGQSQPLAAYEVVTWNNSSSGQANIAIGIDSTSTPYVHPTFSGFEPQIQSTAAFTVLTMRSDAEPPPMMGFHYAQALESTSVGTQTYCGNLNHLMLDTEY